jgi:choline dehydrogenase-like flavoprotein
VTVLVLEKGYVRDNLLSRVPLLSQNFLGPFLQATYRWTEPVEGMGGKKAKMWTAEALGGAARVNGGLVTRGTPAGYDEWKEELGMDDWGWKSVEPFFKKSEKAVGKENSAWRGHDGMSFCSPSPQVCFPPLPD